MKKFIDKTGKRFGNLVVIQRYENCSKTNGARFLCRCDCGTEKVIKSCQLQESGFSTVSCGCIRFMNRGMLKLIHKDLQGMKFGKLSIVEEITSKYDKKNGHKYLCICECGNYHEAYSKTLGNGKWKIKSCGCLRDDAVRITSIKARIALKEKRDKNRLYKCS